MTTIPVETKNKLVQTKIRCLSYSPDGINRRVRVLSDRSVQTAASAPPDASIHHFYSLLEFTPYQAITESSVKIFDLPRKAFLQWKPPTFFEEARRSSSLIIQDIDSSTFRGVLKKESGSYFKNPRSSIRKNYRMEPEMISQEVQTTLRVTPHVLDSNELANVYTDFSVQTSITLIPAESISRLVPLLEANLPHVPDFSAAEALISDDITDSHVTEPETTTNVDPENLETEVKEFEIASVQVYDTDLDLNPFKEVNDNNSENPEENIPNVEQTSNQLKEEISTEHNLKVTLSGSKIQESCPCSANLFNSIAEKLKVRASDLNKIAPQIFSKSDPLEDRVMRMLNSTVTILQTEMFNMMQIFIEEDTGSNCPCTKPVKDMFVQAISQDIESKPVADLQLLPVNQTALSKNTEIKEISLTRKYIDPNTDQTKIIKENIIEEITKRITCNANNETVIEEIIRTTTLRGSPCQKLEETSNGEEIKEVREQVQTNVDDESENDNHNVEETELIPSKDPPSLPEEESVVTETVADNTPYVSEDMPSVPNALENIGDYPGTKKYDNIECECHPRERGGAPPSLRTDDALSHGVRNEVSEVTADNVRSRYSCPQTNIATKVDVKAGPSLPNVNDQIIRLSVVYKQGSNKPDIHTEEMLTPGRQITIAPNKTASSHLAPVCLQFEKDNQDIRLLCECNKFVCAKQATTKLGSPTRNPNYEQSETENAPCRMECPIHCTKPLKSMQPPISSIKSNMSKNTDIQITVAYTAGDNVEECSDDLKARSSTLMYEHNVTYIEPYWDSINDNLDTNAILGMQTTVSCKDKLQSESLSSVGQDENLIIPCNSKTEIPWPNITLPSHGTYMIKSIREPEAIQTGGNITNLDTTYGKAENDQVELLEQPLESLQEHEAILDEESPESEQKSEEILESPKEQFSYSASEPISILVQNQQTDAVKKVKHKKVSTGVRLQPLLCDMNVDKVNEPYLEGLYRAFKNADEEESSECGSETEIPWNDIILPQNCKIQNMKKSKKCIYKTASINKEPTGTFMPYSYHPAFFQESDTDDELKNIPTASSISQQSIPASIMNEYIGMEEYPSTLMPVGASIVDDDNLSVFSTISTLRRKLKRSPETFMLKIDFDENSNYSISFQGIPGGPQAVQVESVPIHASVSEPFNVTKDDASAVQDSFVTSTSIPKSELSPNTPVLDDTPRNHENLTVAQNFLHKMPITSHSCDYNKPQGVPNIPLITHACDFQASSDSPSSKQPNQTKVPVEDIKIKLKVSASRLKPKQSASASSSNKCICTKSSTARALPDSKKFVSKKSSNVCAQNKSSKIFVPRKYVHEDGGTQNASKDDPVEAALKSYEMEMKPLKQALKQLQEKILSLKLPEMKDCIGCNIDSKEKPQVQQRPMAPIIFTNKVRIPGHPNTLAQTTMRFKSPAYGNNPTMCPYFQPAAFQTPPYAQQLPSSVAEQRFPQFARYSPYQTPYTDSQYYYDAAQSPQQSMSSSISKSKHSGIKHSSRDRKEEKHYRDKNLSLKKLPYKDLGYKKDRKKSSSSGSDFGSQDDSDVEAICPRNEKSDNVQRKQSSDCDRKNKRQVSDYKSSKINVCPPCINSQETKLRPGKALKTSPDDFLPACQHSSKKKHRP